MGECNILQFCHWTCFLPMLCVYSDNTWLAVIYHMKSSFIRCSLTCTSHVCCLVIPSLTAVPGVSPFTPLVLTSFSQAVLEVLYNSGMSRSEEWTHVEYATCINACPLFDLNASIYIIVKAGRLWMCSIITLKKIITTLQYELIYHQVWYICVIHVVGELSVFLVDWYTKSNK